MINFSFDELELGKFTGRWAFCLLISVRWFTEAAFYFLLRRRALRSETNGYKLSAAFGPNEYESGQQRYAKK